MRSIKPWFKLTVTCCVTLLAIAGCGAGEPEENDPSAPNLPEAGELVASSKQRVMSPQVSNEDLRNLTENNGTFAFDLYEKALAEGGNLIYSPHSISIALAMTYAGARNRTETQMASALRFDLSQQDLHPAFNALDLELARRGQGAAGQDGGEFRLNIVNSTWGQKGYHFLPDYLDVLALNYGTGLRLLDFESDPEQCRGVINEWVEGRTEGRIKDLLTPNSITTETRLVLTNAVYFNAAWKEPFETADTRPGTFHLADGGTTTAQMMHSSKERRYHQGEGYQAVELPYDGEELSMLILVPDQGTLDAFERLLSMQIITETLQGLEMYTVDLAFPKFEVEARIEGLKQYLIDMGMIDAFGVESDFSGMDGSMMLYVSDVLHKAFINVNEAGTEAAAATAVPMNFKGMPGEYIKVEVDRPFVYVIRDHRTNAILFVGRVVDPS